MSSRARNRAVRESSVITTRVQQNMHADGIGPGTRARCSLAAPAGSTFRCGLRARLTVLGSLNMDISVTVPRLPAPGATVLGGAAVFAPGGKGANQAVAAARLGGDVLMIGCVGDDDFGRTLRAALVAEGVHDSRGAHRAGVPTGLAMITVDKGGENIITVAPGANREVSTAEVNAVSRGRIRIGPAPRRRRARRRRTHPATSGDQRRGAGPGDHARR